MRAKVKIYDPKGGSGPAELTVADVDALYETARRERLLGIIGRDTDEVTDTDFLDAVRMSTLFFAGYRPEDGEPVGFVYLSNAEGDTARIHFAIFKAGREFRHDLGRQALDLCFKSYPWACLIGLIPSIFTGAVNFARELGGQSETTIPGACWMARLKRAVDGVQFLFLPNMEG